MSSYCKGRLVSLPGIKKGSLAQLVNPYQQPKATIYCGVLRFHYVAKLADYAGLDDYCRRTFSMEGIIQAE